VAARDGNSIANGEIPESMFLPEDDSMNIFNHLLAYAIPHCLWGKRAGTFALACLENLCSQIVMDLLFH